MSRFTHPLNRMLRIALLLLLLSMQSFVLAHEIDHGVVHTGSVCATCSIGNGHDGAIPVSPASLLVIESCLPEPVLGRSAILAPARLIPESRAPPASH